MTENQASEAPVARILALLFSTELSEEDADTIAHIAYSRIRRVEADDEHDAHGIKRGVISTP